MCTDAVGSTTVLRELQCVYGLTAMLGLLSSMDSPCPCPLPVCEEVIARPPLCAVPVLSPGQPQASLPVVVFHGPALSSLWNPGVAVCCALGLFLLLPLGSALAVNQQS